MLFLSDDASDGNGEVIAIAIICTLRMIRSRTHVGLARQFPNTGIFLYHAVGKGQMRVHPAKHSGMGLSWRCMYLEHRKGNIEANYLNKFTII